MPRRASDAVRRGAWLALALAAGAALLPRAAAETETGQLTVSASVLSGCALIGGTLDFGNYISGQESDLDATGEIRFVNCIGTLRFELDGGGNGNVNDRKMRGADGTLDYQIYTSASRNSVWGMGGNAFVLPLNGATPSSGFVPVHGRIRGGQAVPAGNYTDIVNITLTF
jgi:spore coat protein U-like protein